MPFCSNGCGKRCAAMKRKYCSVRCHHEHDFKQRVKLVENGLYPASPQSPFLKKYLVWKYGARCLKCGWAERHSITGKVPVEVEHIDGNWRNNSLKNLTLLCPNCHSLTATYRALNRGNGRAHRLGGRDNPLQGESRKKLAGFPLPRSLVEAVEAMEPTLRNSSPA